ncbi:MAG: FAD-dependent oxidoreductase [Pseudomonadota bacterium]
MPADPLLTPFTLKHLTFKNRIITTSHEPAYSEEGMPKDRYRAYHVARAQGGIAMTMTAGSAVVSPDSPPVFGNLLAYKDEIVPWFRKLVDECHAHDCKVMVQLTHLGRRSHWNTGDWLPLLSASDKREPAHRGFPKPAERWDIERIVSHYADAVERMQAAGLDGVEVQAYCHLIDQFWSDVTNTRDDEFGGSLANRLRFSDLLLRAMRDRVGPDFIIGIRQTADEGYRKGGITEEEGLLIAAHLEREGLVDFFNVIRGRCDTDPAMSQVIPVTGMRSAPHLDMAEKVKSQSALAVFHAARIPDVATARHAVLSGQIDLVGMTRAHIAEPDIVHKLSRGQEADIRPCVGATFCLDRIYLGQAALCVHNPATGREQSQPHRVLPSQRKRCVVVVGAGPAGLEAARVSVARGHEVHVLEAAPAPGGQLRLAAQNPRRRELLGIVDWRVQQIEASGGTLRYHCWADTEQVLAHNPDVVFVATGGVAHTDILEAGNELVVSAWDIIAGDVKPGERVLLYDDAGDHTGLQAAEVVGKAGAELDFVTPDRGPALDVMGVNLSPYMRELQACNMTTTLGRRLLSVSREGNRLVAHFNSDYREDLRFEAQYDQIIVNHGTEALSELYFDLLAGSSNTGEVDYDALIAGQPQTIVRNPEGRYQVFRLGDAVSGRNIHAAVFDGLRYAKVL